MDENGERDHLIDNDNNNIRYEINDNVIKWFRVIKSGYLLMIIIFLTIISLMDNKGYNTNLIYATIVYIYIELFSFFVYIYKIYNHRGMRQCRIVSAILRVCWFIITYYGFKYWLEETKTGTIFYYATGYVYISNLIFIVFSTMITCFIFCFVCRINSSGGLGEQNRRTAISIIDDVSDIQIYSNILKLNMFNDTVCSICLENFEQDDRVRVLTCRHYYHDECIKEWFERSSTCPLCNQDVFE